MSLKTAAFFVHSEEPVLIFLVKRHEIAFETFDKSNPRVNSPLYEKVMKC